MPADLGALFASVPCALAVLDPELSIIAVSDAYLKLARRARDALVGAGPQALWAPSAPDEQQQSALRSSLDRARSTLRANTVELSGREFNGVGVIVRHFRITSEPALSSDGALSHITQRVEDISELATLRAGEAERRRMHEHFERRGAQIAQTIARSREAQRALLDSEQRYRMVVRAASDGIFDVDVASGRVWWSERLLESLGYSEAEFGGTMTWIAENVLHPEDGERGSAKLSALLSDTGTPERQEAVLRLRHASGDWRTAVVRAFVQRDERGRALKVLGAVSDVTERKRAEQELERLAQAAEHVTDAIVSCDLDGRICRLSGGAETIFGFSAEEMVGLTWAELGAHTGESEEVARQYAAVLARVLAGETVRYERRSRRKDGAVLDLQATSMPWRVDGRFVGVTTTTVDITERKRAERERERALAALEEAQRLARLGSWTWEPQTGAATWSAQTYELFGRDPSPGPAIGTELARYVHPDDRQRVEQIMAAPSPGGFELDFRILVGERNSERVLHAIGYPDPTRPGCFMGTFQDVSAQRRAELAEAANQAKSEFLSRMSHELRTPLNAISGFGQLLAMDELESRQAEYIGYVLKGAEHMLALVNDVLDLSRIEAGQLKVSPEAVALLGTVREAVELMAPLTAAGEAELRIDTGGLAEDCHVHADAQRLKQVLVNLLSNAIKYNRPGGRVEISFETLDSSPARVRTLVTDTGVGIAARDIEKLFEPFERLDAARRAIDGTGLGLALSKGLIEAMGGSITVSSTPGVGSTFTIELAALATSCVEHVREASASQQQRPGVAEAQTRLKVLYIEDNVSNLRLIERVLERHATVELIPAMQGSLGLTLAREHHPDMIILDLHLPDINGEVVLTRLKADPSTRDIPVIVLTADASKGLAERLARIGSCEFLSKPIDVPRLLTVLETYIHDAARGDVSCAE